MKDKTHNKRKSDSTVIKSPKKKKTEKDEYTEVHFKVELKDPITTFLALDKFHDAADKFLEGEGYDIVAGYCRSSEECTEILQLLEGGKRKPSELQLIFETLECILIRLVDDLSKYQSVGHTIVKKIWGSHTGSLYSSLSQRNKASQIKTTLKLLSAMTMLGETSARAILTQIDFSNPNIQLLYGRRDRKDPQDVRTCMIHFVLGFLLSGSDSVIRQLMDLKDFSSGLFSGLCYDNIETVQLVLNTLLEKVIQNPVISKTQKVRIFTEENMKHLGNLYHWKGIQEWRKYDKYDKHDKQDDTMEVEETDNSEEKQMAAEMVHQVLIELCTTYKYGIIFFDKSFGTSQKSQNHVITAFLTSLTKVIETPLIQELVVASLVASPDQLQYYLPSLHSSVTPRVSKKWITTMDFLMKIYSCQPENFSLTKIREVMPVRKMVRVLLTTLLPPSQIFHSVIQGLKHKELAVRHVVMDFLKIVLQRLTVLLKLLSGPEGSTLMSLYSPEDWKNIIEGVKEDISKAIPDVPSLFQCWDKLVTQMKDKEPKLEEEASLELPAISEPSHMIRLEQILSLYQEVFPSCLTDNPANISKIMEGVRYLTEQHVQSEDQKDLDEYLPQLYLLKLLSGADSRKLPWVKESQEGHTLMYLLLSMVKKVKNKPQLVKTTQHLICQLLISTGLFDFNKDELSLWIRHYTRHECETDELTKFLSKVITTYVSNPYPYSDKVNDYVSEGMSLESSGADVDTLSIGTTDSNIDALLEMEEEDINEQNTDIEEDDPVLNHIRFPFSPLIIVAYDLLGQKDHQSQVTTDYISSLLVDLLHCQLNPLPLVSLLQSHEDVTIDKTVMLYFKSFIDPGKAQKLPKQLSVVPLTTVSISLANIYIAGKATNQQTVLSTVSSVAPEDVSIVTKQLMLYTSHLLKAGGKDDISRFKMVKFFFKCLEEIVKLYSDKMEKQEPMDTNQNESSDQKEESDKTTSSQTMEDGSEKDLTCSKEFQQLSVSDNTNEDIFKEIVVTVLRHPTILNWFLFVKNETGSSVTSDTVKMLMTPQSQLVTTCTCSFVQILEEKDVKNLEHCFVEYVSKLQTLLCGIQSVEMSKLSNIIKDVQDSLPVLTKNLPVEKKRSLLETILKIPSSFLINDDQLTNLSYVAIELFLKLMKDTGAKLLKLHSQCTKSLFDLLLKTSDEKLMGCCDAILQRQPHLSTGLEKNVLDSLIKSNSIIMAENLILHNHLIADYFRESLQKGKYDKHLERITSLVLFFVRKVGYNPNLDEDKKALLKVVCKKYKLLMDNVYSMSGNQGDCLVELIISLVNSGVLDKQKVLSNQITLAGSHGIHNLPFVKLLQHLNEESTDNPMQLLKLYVKTVTEAHSKKENLDRIFVDCVMEKLDDLLQRNSEELEFEGKALPKFLKVVLKSRFSDKRTFKIISKLVEHIFDWPEELPLTTLFQMVMSHSLFLPIMFNEKHQDVKGDLTILLLHLIESDSSCCSDQHFGILLGSYMATLSDTDQRLLKLMYLYEKNECVISEYRPYLWGPKAVEHHSVQKTIGPSLMKKASIDQVIENLDKAILHKSILNFPLRRKLQAYTLQDSTECKSSLDIYDPCFILPLFSHILSPDQLIDCRKFIERGCLGYILAALSCHDSTMRGAAYFVLDNFVHHLEGSRFPEKDQILYVMVLLRNSIEKPNVKLPCIITVFLTKAVRLMLKAEQHMYQMINSFLYLKPTLDIYNVPEFYKLFNSSTLEYKEERGWILSLLLDGLRETADYRVFEKRYTFKLLLSFFDTAISDSSSQGLVLKILNRACQEKTVALDLTRNHGIVTWLINAINTNDSKRFDIFTEILSGLWTIVLGDKEENSDNKTRFLPTAFSREMFTACIDLLRKFSIESSVESVIKLLETILSILQHLQFTCDQLKGQGYTYIAPSLSCSDVKALSQLTNSFSSKSLPEELPTTDHKKVVKGDDEEDVDQSRDFQDHGENEIQDQSTESVSKNLSFLTLKILLFWNPFCGKSSVSQIFTVPLKPSSDQCQNCLDVCTMIIAEIKHCEDMDLILKTLQWIRKNVEHLINADLIKDDCKKAKLEHMTDGLVQLYGIINIFYRNGKCLGQGQKLENATQSINSILLSMSKAVNNDAEHVSLTESVAKDHSTEAVTMLLKSHFTS
ncbi:nucleolar pre-ribosomal-associated protein 1-like [Mytilus galloprovincialis]|uniref:nucleolar pre-ribosomal-associated protein 1-like n=1 Tax=Mytilus galloprovincialis TaxID=29158 RepID=UPI003F7C6080